MVEQYYPAIVTKHGDDSYKATIPDLKGVRASGTSINEALAAVTEAGDVFARDHIEAGREVNRWLPLPRDLNEIPSEEGSGEVARALVPIRAPGETIKISISIDKGLLQSADRAAAREGLSRSSYIAAAIGARMRGVLQRPISTADAQRLVLMALGDAYEGGGLLVDRRTNRAETSYVSTPPRRKKKAK